ncbi:NAD(+) synthase [Boudabousia marimammalium]|uniref:Glutamine-dependent NAD(+) synthetase n=1 Tax=Boudabousia marimammalium TaxID=156892 RepID=A0A1Q5PRW6_9ACTO|nr:NAD(+) synthase [Boudabousia marimammalium]OKL50321.1 NAD(+) synthase [Boudabousia marimammalium]
MDFRNIYRHGLIRAAAVTLPVTPAQPAKNAETIISAARDLAQQHTALAVFPELSLSGYALDDILLNQVLLDEVDEAISTTLKQTAELMTILVVGAPLRVGNRLYNCVLTMHRGTILGVAPKSYIPNYREFYEKRHFALGTETPDSWVEVAGQTAPFGTNLLYMCEDVPGFTLFTEVCEDMWVPIPPSAKAALAGATVLTNSSSSPITVGKSDDRHLLCQSASSRCAAAYLYSAAGEGESTTDLAWDGQTMIYENGRLLAESERFAAGITYSISDIDVERLHSERMRNGSYDDNRVQELEATDFVQVKFELEPPTTEIPLIRSIDRFPFVPDDPSQLERDCYEAYNVQVHGLVKRLQAIGNPKIVIGVSGGLDSTHALIVAARAMDLLGRPRTDILAYTMPGFATSDFTKQNAIDLSQSLGVTFSEIDIRPAAQQMLSDMGHPYAEGESVYDITFENVQAGLRTDYLFRLANHQGGIVLGTGDLSELALGWCTYGVGDQMSHYGVNAGVPKTLIQHLIRWVVSSHQFGEDTNRTLLAILDTEISPELIPAKPGEKPQSTQAKIGPYPLQDFNLYYMLRWGMRPEKIAFLAEGAWADNSRGEWPAGFPEDEKVAYQLPEILHWERLFMWRFFSSQFKRSAMPNGPKVMAGGSLSPRGDWRMPSDVSALAWVDRIDRLAAELGIEITSA